MMWLTIILLFLLIVFTPCLTKKTKKHTSQTQKRQVVVVPSSHKAHHSSEIFVYGHGGGSGQSEDDQVDKDMISSLSSNILSTTNLLHSQSELIENLSDEVGNLRNMFKRQEVKMNSRSASDIEAINNLKISVKNATDLVSALAVIWSKSEKNYVSIIKKLDGRINGFKGMLDNMNGKWEQRFQVLSKQMKNVREDVSNVQKVASKSSWPRGNYCILANYACPKGFRRQHGFVKAMYMYATGSRFVKGAKIGSSFVGCYGNKCGQYGNYGVVNIVGCCK